MALFHRVKNPDGTFSMIEMPVEESAAVQILPPKPTVKKPIAARRLQCAVCDEKFAKPGIFSMHFNKKHKDLVEDKDSWRKYMENLDGSNS